MRLHEITQLLTESRLDYLINTYSEKVGLLFNKDRTYRKISGSYQNNSQKYDQSAIYWITDLMNKDPSHNGMYTQWMLIQYTKGNFQYEDSGNLLDDLEYFHVNKRAFEQKDINKYTVDQLYDAKKQIEDQADPVQSKRQEKAQLKQGAEKVLETENVLVIHPQTKEAAQYYGSNTRWCTSAINNNQFDHYNNRGPLYIIIDKKTNEKFQIHFKSREVMDAKDKEITARYLIEKYPEMLNHLKEEFNTHFPFETLSPIELHSHAKKNSDIILDTENVSVIMTNTYIAYGYYFYKHYHLRKHSSSKIIHQSFVQNLVLKDYNDDPKTYIYVVIDKKSKQNRYLMKFHHSLIVGLENIDKCINVKQFIENYPEIFNHFKKEFNVKFPYVSKTKKQLENHIQNKENNKVIIDTKDYLVAEPLTPLAFYYYVENTKWVFGKIQTMQNTHRFDELFFDLIKEGPIYIIVDKTGTQQKYKVHFVKYESYKYGKQILSRPNTSFRNKNNDRVSIGQIVRIYPEFYKFFGAELREAYPMEVMTPYELEEHTKKNTNIILDTNTISVLNPRTRIALWILSEHMDWRHWIKTPGYPDINDSGSVEFDLQQYILIDKKTDEKYYFCLSNDCDGDIKNKKNKSVPINSFIEKYPEVYNQFEEEFNNHYQIS